MLELRGIEARYGAAIALRDVSLAIGAGEVVSVIGPNGAGKTTLINSIAGMQPIAAGEMTLDGTALTALPSHAFCDAGIAIVPEGRRLFTTMTVRENLELGGYRSAARPKRRARIDQMCAMFPVLGTCLGRAAGTLSGGQQQMVAIARALLNDNRLLLVDEPTKGLAPLLVAEVAGVLERVAELATVLLVEQNLGVVERVARDAVVLDTGRVVHIGPAKELLADKPMVHRLLGVGHADA